MDNYSIPSADISLELFSFREIQGYSIGALCSPKARKNQNLKCPNWSKIQKKTSTLANQKPEKF